MKKLPLLAAENLTFSYSIDSPPILENTDFSINKGEFIGLAGDSGSGKSTIALLLTGFIPHRINGTYNGNLKYLGRPIKEINFNFLSQKIGLIQQSADNQIITTRVLDEVAFGLENLCFTKNEIVKRIALALESVDMKDHVLSNLLTMSGGERHRIAIASILAMIPEIIIVDEPTAHLDVKGINKVEKVLEDLKNKGKTIILIEHDFHPFRHLIDRLFMIEQKKLVIEDQKPVLKPIQLKHKEKSSLQKKSTAVVLNTENLSVNFGKKNILSDVTLKVNEGEIVGIIGLNGAGKSTLLKCILNLQDYEGNIFLKGISIRNRPTWKLSKDIGLIFSSPNHQLFETTVKKEMAFGPRNFKMNLDDLDEKIESTLEKLRLIEYIDKQPFILSYGEKRRLNIGSIEIYNPSILCSDEPFIAQDSKNIELLIDIFLKRKQKGLTSIIVSHKLFLLDFIDKVILLDKGKIVAVGNPNDENIRIKMENLGLSLLRN